MSHHHHHPHEGHTDGLHASRPRKPIHHDWRFYAAGGLIMLALVIYLLTEDLRWQPTIVNTQATSNAH